MKLPKHFNVFGKKIKVKVADLGPSFDGMFYSTEDLIVISSTVDPTTMDRTVIHEFLHAVIERCSLTQVVSYPSEEVLVDMVTKALLENFDVRPKIKK